MAHEYDLVIVGGGTGGYVAAIRASQLGLKTAIVENEKLGGTCLHKGCIPSKALLRSAEVYRQSKQASDYGVEIEKTVLHFNKVQERKNKIVEKLHQGVLGLIKKGKIDVYQGYGRILGPSIFSPTAGTVSVELEDGSENEMLIPKNVLIATGSKPRVFDGLDVDGTSILTSDHALELEELPKSMIIIGGGVIGVEWASLLADFDVEVTLVEYAERILPTEDQEISKEMTRHLKKKGITILTSAMLQIDSIDKMSDHVEIDIEKNGETVTLKAEKMLLSVGRIANTESLGLDNTEIIINNQGYIDVNNYYQTKESHIYAIGDVIGGLQLAHVASREGVIAVEHMAEQKPEPLNYNQIPSAIYSHPEIASIGLTEQQAKENGFSVKTGKTTFKAIGKALVYGEDAGFVKVIADKDTNDLLGIHMIGPHVTDMISEAGLAMVLDATPWEITQTIHPHPSLSEAIGEAALAVEGRKIHG
ncbi:dihydrolipoyl dehydrogenase [Aquibacillus koreensis]|uniref:Dihydrolipoyl dehydrogenase n=1 Tax=Aquibacillus koreensis TaxID=279446 RepID=A0A9X4AI27_9BACI|nr:dihydrolipoyl dehydrogenase [Aquibacillus koreensis]MCT2537499.1 dihydrolipoyl dehydrogenase [Aquibacillus koreensis]MDC3418945.1 dihydrolipoyl dehydrogenase [Aquibacillus koreensis]